MKYSVRLREEADHDLSKAAAWYERQRAGLGHEFLDQILATLSAIGDQPQSFPDVHRGTRRALVTRFPFAVFYRVCDQDVVVVAVLHGSRHPSRWQTRT